MFDERVVIHYLDGSTLRGYGDSFLPWEEEVLVKDQHEKMVHVRLADVKIICFVRHHDSDCSATHKASPPLQFQAVPGRRIQLRFKDGEQLVGVASLEAPPRSGFFLTPLNPNSNNRRVFINLAALESFRFET